ncbi:hypothetical protein SERLA73DRAFT_127673 [Serpula lacrymans var. lacrymans S7.3]|uniref:Uncharacterized protein n=1 Tax=Serpula lacrymans var. lacrymans (strain S7.3) TaxID=936435 RepID=F8QHI0_SERL3|nr:hypothetical protein SERLA73DRAFT_127673 [Serpula lacrymans var. lacrymans S7.3]
MQVPGAQDFTTADFQYCPILSVVQELLSNPNSLQFHFVPYNLKWKPEEIQELPGEPGCELECCILALMFWSDATQLTAFSTIKVWPLYMFLGNESKYQQSRPHSYLCHNIAYFKVLPDSFKDFTTGFAGQKGTNSNFFSHCNCEFTHAQWDILLDNDIIEACKHGIIVECFDRIQHRFYIQFFTYSANYPEKILLLCLRNLGQCPCPRCLILMSQISNIGTPQDRKLQETQARVNNTTYLAKILSARKLIYKDNYAVNNTAVERLLKPHSLVPTTSALSAKLSPFNINIFSLFPVNILHETELGVWKVIYMHIMHILHCQGQALINEFDRFFCLIPESFSLIIILVSGMFHHLDETQSGNSSTNSSEMKRTAA